MGVRYRCTTSAARVGTLAALVGTLLALNGCTGPGVATGAAPMAAMNGMDTSMGRLTRSAPDNLLIVLLTDEFHQALTQGRSVRRSDTLPPRYARFVAELGQRHNLTRVADWPLASIGVQCLVFRAGSAASRARVVAALQNQPGIDHVQPLQYFRTLNQPLYDDPYLGMQHNLDTLDVLATHRWATGRGVRVAVIDTGLDDRHPDLDDAVVLQRNFVDRDQAAFRRDRHGTAVAGVIAAGRNNGTGMVGVAPDAQVLALKSCWQDADRSASCSSFTLAKALNFAITQRVDAINLSLGGPRDALLERLVRRAVAADISVIGAVHPQIEDAFPGAIPEVIAVDAGERGTAPGAALRAPGAKILAPIPGDGYEFESGSSFSAAQVTGLVALLRQREPHISPAMVKALLLRSADNGVVNSCRMLSGYVGGANCGE